MSTTRSYNVTGMTCGHCVTSVTDEVQKMPGVSQVDVVLDSGAMTITSEEPIDDAALRAAVEEAGYELAGP